MNLTQPLQNLSLGPFPAVEPAECHEHFGLRTSRPFRNSKRTLSQLSYLWLSLAISGYLSSLSSLNIFDIFHLQLHQLPRASQSSLCHVSRHRSYRFTLSAGLTRTAEGSAARTAEIVRLRERTCHRSKNPCTCIR